MAVRASEADERTVQAQFEAVVNDVLLEVDRSYYGALLAKQQIRVQEEAIKLLERQLEMARNRFAAGARPRFDVLQAEVALQNDQPPLLRARNTYRIAVDDLRRLVGLPFARGLEPESIQLEEAWPFPKVPLGMDEAVELALQQRPELAALEEVRNATEERLGIAKRNRRPVLEVYGNYGANSYTFQNNLDDYLHGWGLGARATWPFFDGGKSKGQEMQASSLLAQTRIQAEGESLRIEGEARRAYFDYQVAEEILESATLTIEQAEEALRLANNRYGAGGATQLDVLQTQLEVTRARLVKVQADHDYHVAVSRLRRAVGMTP
jgi:outer membrane protein TolC